MLKIVIIGGAFYFTYQKLVSDQLLSLFQLKQQFSLVFSHKIWIILVLLLFTDANLLSEMFQWKTLVSIEKKISFYEAYEQCLASLSISFITPSLVGKKVIKDRFYEFKKRKNILTINSIVKLGESGVILIFGIIGLSFLIGNFSLKMLNFSEILLITIVSIIVVFIFIKQFRAVMFSNYLTQIPLNIYLKTFGFTMFRYLVLSHQFYFLLKMLGIESDYFTLLNLIFCLYFIASVIPDLKLFDWLIKGAIAMWLFSFIDLNALTIISAATVMWILNIAVPALMGSFFVLNLKNVHKA